MAQPQQKPWLLEFRSSETFIVLTVTIAIFIDAFIYGMIVPIIPIALVERAGARPEDAQSLVSILLAVYAAFLLIGSPLFGFFADQSHLRTLPFVLGLIALAVSTALFVFGTTFPALLVARALQGLSASAVWVVGLAIVADSVPSERVGAAMGQTTIGLTWGFILGPMMGGYMFEYLGWYGTFSVPMVMVFVDVALRFLMIEVPRSSREFKSGQVTQSEDSEAGCGSYDTFSAQEGGSGASLCRDHDEAAPLLQSSGDDRIERKEGKKANVLHLLLTPRLPCALLASAAMSIVFTALEAVLPLFTMEVFHWKTSAAGLIFLTISLPTFGGVYIGKGIDQFGVRIVGTTAFALGSCAWISMRFITKDSPEDITLLVTLLLLLGTAIAALEITGMTEVSQVVGDYEAENPGVFGDKSPVAQAYAMFNMAFAGGQLLGPLVAGAVRVNAGWGAMSLVLGLICAATAIPFAVFSGPPKKKNDTSDGR